MDADRTQEMHTNKSVRVSMSNGNKPTSNEHYIPRMYLKGFSEIKYKKNKENPFIWQYDLYTMEQSTHAVPITSIGYIKDLCELRNSNNEIVAQNYIEDKLCLIETRADTVFKSIIQKAQDVDHFIDKPFLSEEEMSVLILFIAVQMLRDPESLEIMCNASKNLSPGITNHLAKNGVLLKFFSSESNYKSIVKECADLFCGMAFQIGIGPEDSIITSDRPYAIEKMENESGIKGFKSFSFPITSRIVLYLYPLEAVLPQGRNCCFRLDKDRIRDLTVNIAFSAQRWVFSRCPLTDDQIGLIKTARQLREKSS